MRLPPANQRDLESLQPAGRRWGFGAHSVVPYLVHHPAAYAKAGDDDSSIRNPVFSHMDSVLRTMRRSH